jgi:pyruvate/2-oxoglutarate dehydrogenase complex dihydrolipoamide dehydrogenase (E3) component
MRKRGKHHALPRPRPIRVAASGGNRPATHHTRRLRAGRIFINVGGRARVPPTPGINEVPYLANSSMMDVDFLPHHLINFGGSHIGLDGCRRVQAAASAVIFI